MRDTDRRGGIKIFAAAIFILAAAALLPAPAPGAQGVSVEGVTVPWGCPFHFFTGMPCPLCGLTRSMVCLLHGRLSEAVGFHPLGPAALGLIVFELAAGTYLMFRRGNKPPGLSGLSLHAPAIALAAALAAQWIIALAAA